MRSRHRVRRGLDARRLDWPLVEVQVTATKVGYAAAQGGQEDSSTSTRNRPRSALRRSRGGRRSNFVSAPARRSAAFDPAPTGVTASVGNPAPEPAQGVLVLGVFAISAVERSHDGGHARSGAVVSRPTPGRPLDRGRARGGSRLGRHRSDPPQRDCVACPIALMMMTGHPTPLRWMARSSVPR